MEYICGNRFFHTTTFMSHLKINMTTYILQIIVSSTSTLHTFNTTINKSQFATVKITKFAKNKKLVLRVTLRSTKFHQLKRKKKRRQWRRIPCSSISPKNLVKNGSKVSGFEEVREGGERESATALLGLGRGRMGG